MAARAAMWDLHRPCSAPLAGVAAPALCQRALRPCHPRRRLLTRSSLVVRLVVPSVVILGLARGTCASFCAIVTFVCVWPRREPKHGQGTAEPPAHDSPEAEFPVDYIIDGSWVRSSNERVWELTPPPAGGVGSAASGGVAAVRRLVMPQRSADVHFLRLVGLDDLRVELWPHQEPQPHVDIHISTSALSYSLPDRVRGLRWPRWPGPRKQWFTLFRADVQFPGGVLLSGCTPKWRWASFNSTKEFLNEQFEGPFRIVELVCPSRPQGLLLPPGRRLDRHALTGALRLALLAALVAVCAAQVVLLAACISMLLLQTGFYRD